MLWPEEGPKHPMAALETHVGVLRSRLSRLEPGRTLVQTEPAAYRFAAEEVHLDLDEFDELTSSAAEAPTSEARRLLDQALSLVQGEPFENEPEAPWVIRVRAKYEHSVLRARLDAAEAALAEGALGVGLDRALQAAEDAPTDERASRLMMLARWGLGDQSGAVNAYLELRRRLSTELGLEPLPETEGVYLAILAGRSPEEFLPGDMPRTAPGFRRDRGRHRPHRVPEGRARPAGRAESAVDGVRRNPRPPPPDDPTDASIADISDAGARTLGFTREEVRSGRIDLIPHEDLPTVHDRLATVIADGTAWSDDVTFCRRDGQAIRSETFAARVWVSGRPMVLLLSRPLGAGRAADPSLLLLLEDTIGDRPA